MANTFGSEIEVGPPPVTLRKRRSFGAIVVVVLLLILAVGGGLVWLNLDAVTDMLHGAGNPAATAANSDVLASAPEPGVSAADFAAYQQQTGSAIQSTTDQLNAQQAELKRMSDQVQGLTSQIAGLTAKIDQMQAPRANSTPAAAAAAAAAPVAPRPAAPAAPRRRPVDRPAGAVSVGGAPLQSTPAR